MSVDPRAEALAAALAGIDAWPVPHAAAVVVGPDGLIAARGDTATAHPVASVTKPLTAAVVLLMADEGLVDLDEPVGPTAAQGATVRHLLAHAGGLGFEAGDRTMAPGVRRVYSNWGYEVLGDLVAAREARPFADVLRERLTGPLGMAATVLDGSPAWGARASTDDLGRFVHELLSPRVLPPSARAGLTTVAFPDLDGVLPGFGRQRPNPWTLGLELRDAKDPHWGGPLPPDAVGHFGRSGSLVWAAPSAGLGLATLSGRDFDTWAAEGWPALAAAVLAAVGGPGPDATAGADLSG
ncbi:MAG: serine hydrolase domain-containing protein [Nitriliruptoraceae bacterium]